MPRAEYWFHANGACRWRLGDVGGATARDDDSSDRPGTLRGFGTWHLETASEALVVTLTAIEERTGGARGGGGREWVAADDGEVDGSAGGQQVRSVAIDAFEAMFERAAWVGTAGMGAVAAASDVGAAAAVTTAAAAPAAATTPTTAEEPATATKPAAATGISGVAMERIVPGAARAAVAAEFAALGPDLYDYRGPYLELRLAQADADDAANADAALENSARSSAAKAEVEKEEEEKKRKKKAKGEAEAAAALDAAAAAVAGADFLLVCAGAGLGADSGLGTCVHTACLAALFRWVCCGKIFGRTLSHFLPAASSWRFCLVVVVS